MREREREVEVEVERLRDEIVAGLRAHPGAAAAERGGFFEAYVPELVRLGIDVAVRQFGGPIEEAIAAHREQIRRVVSDATLAFLRGIVDELGQAPAT